MPDIKKVIKNPDTGSPRRADRELGDMLESEFADRGGRKYLRSLFPGGPVAQGMRIAGLAVPTRRA